MKKILKISVLIGAILLVIYACNKSFLKKPPQGSLDEAVLATKDGVQGLLVGAYSLLDGEGGANGNIGSSGSNWIYGGLSGGDAHKGSQPGDNGTLLYPFQTWTVESNNAYIEEKWQTMYDGIQRSNDVLHVMRIATGLSPLDTLEFSAQARFLRGFYHFELKKVFNKVPYIDENISYANGNWNQPNDKDIWPNIEADFLYAMNTLPAIQPYKGQVNKYAAEAFLAKAYMFQQKYTDALPLLNDLITNGVTAQGEKYGLQDHYADNFNAAFDNSKESVFGCQASVNDGAGGNNGNYGDVTNFPIAGPGTNCCGYNQPSYSLVNTFKTDPVSGLPDPIHYNDVDVKNDEGILSSQPFTPYTGTLDPRLDWTVGRRGIPYLDWGIMAGNDWIRDQASEGPYLPVKNVTYKSQQGVYTDNSSWTNGLTAINYTFIRFADVLLWAAEVEVEIGSLDQAEAYVNMVRNRAADTSGWVKAIPGSQNYNGYAANYFIKPYPTGYFAAQGQDNARTLVRFERRIEFGMEGHQFFDLVRYGTAAELDAYALHESTISGYTVMSGAKFTKGKSEYFPIPQSEIDKSVVNGTQVLQQNPGY